MMCDDLGTNLIPNTSFPSFEDKSLSLFENKSLEIGLTKKGNPRRVNKRNNIYDEIPTMLDIYR